MHIVQNVKYISIHNNTDFYTKYLPIHTIHVNSDEYLSILTIQTVCTIH